MTAVDWPEWSKFGGLLTQRCVPFRRLVSKQYEPASSIRDIRIRDLRQELDLKELRLKEAADHAKVRRAVGEVYGTIFTNEGVASGRASETQNESAGPLRSYFCCERE